MAGGSRGGMECGRHFGTGREVGPSSSSLLVSDLVKRGEEAFVV